MSKARKSTDTIPMVDLYCQFYRDLFPNVRTYECFKFLHWGMLGEFPRKTLPAIADFVGLRHSQGLHQMLVRSPWSVESLQQRRLALLRKKLAGSTATLCMGEVTTPKKGKSTDYVARQLDRESNQYMQGLLSLHSYLVQDNFVVPVGFRLFKPSHRLKEGETFQTKSELLKDLIVDSHQVGVELDAVLFTQSYGPQQAFPSGAPAKRLLMVQEDVPSFSCQVTAFQKDLQWKTLAGTTPNGPMYYREKQTLKEKNTRRFDLAQGSEDGVGTLMYSVMSELPQPRENWLYRFQQRKSISDTITPMVKSLGWSDFRVTDFLHIQRWWEIVLSVYTMISLEALEASSNGKLRFCA